MNEMDVLDKTISNFFIWLHRNWAINDLSDFNFWIISEISLALLFGNELTGDPTLRHIGCIDPQCDVVSVVKDAYENARFLCDQYYLSSPEIIINEHNRKRFIFCECCNSSLSLGTGKVTIHHRSSLYRLKKTICNPM